MNTNSLFSSVRKVLQLYVITTAMLVGIPPNSAYAQSLAAKKAKNVGGLDASDRVILIFKIKIGQGFELDKDYYGLRLHLIKTTNKASGASLLDEGDPISAPFEVHNGLLYPNGGGAPTNAIWNSASYITAPTAASSFMGKDTFTYSGNGSLYGSLGSATPVGWATVPKGTITFEGVDAMGGPDPTVTRYFTFDEVTINLGPPPPDCGCENGNCKTGTRLNSVNVSIALGKDQYGHSSGMLNLKSDLPTSYLTNPEALTAVVGTNSEVIRTNIAIRQVRGPKVLADIIATNSYKYDIRFYYTNDVSATKSNGTWVPTGTAYKMVTIENPDGNIASNHLYVTEGEAGVTNVSKYTWDNTNTWTLEPPGGLRKETLTRTWDANNITRTELHSILETNGTLAFQEQKKFTVFPWGEQLVEHVIDPFGARLTNTWQYSTNDAQTAYGSIIARTEPSGYWECYEYDEKFRETNRVACYLNATNGAPADQCRQTITSYSTSNPMVTVVEKVLGAEVGRRYQKWASPEVQDIQCQTTGAVYTASDNLVTITKKLSSGDFLNEPEIIRQPTGVTTFYDYSIVGNQKITSISQGLTNGSNTGILDGTKTTTVVDITGAIISRVVTNITGGSPGIRLSSETYTYDSSDYFKRSPQITHLDGTSSYVNYGCCHLESTVDPDGTTNAFSFDALDRQTDVTRNGITSRTLFNAAGNVIKTIRIGNDNSTMTLNQALYDTAGRKIKETNALSGVTTISESYDGDGQLTRTNTYPDGGTRIQTYYRDGSLKQVSGTATHPLRYEYGIAAESGTNRLYSKEIKLNADSTDSNEFQTNFFDMIGRVYRTVYSDGSSSRSEYDSYGHLVKEQDPDNVTTLYQYNGKGEQEYSVIDTNQNGTIDPTLDRITVTLRDVTTTNSVDVNRTRTYLFMTNGSAISNLVAESRVSTDGRQFSDIRFGLTSQSSIFYPGSGYRIVTNTAPDGSYTVTTNYQGRVTSVTRRDSAGTQLSQTRYAYDAHGRQSSVTDARTGPTTYAFNNADQVTSITTPSPANGQAAQTTSYTYDTMGRQTAVSLPDGGSTTSSYAQSGELQRTSGTRTYPVGYSYDSQGRLKTMTNWSTFAGFIGARVTTWNYDTNRGFLLSKAYPDNQGPSYTYSSAGRLLTRVWARGITTRYTNNTAGDLVGIGYSDGTTPGVTFNLNRLGRRTNIIDAAGTHFLTLHDSGLLLAETNSSGLLAGLNITNGYDSTLRRTTLAFRANGSVQFTHSYAYDSASRMTNVSDGTYSAAYSYLANSPLISQITFRQNTTTRMTTSKTYDNLNRLSQISSVPSGSGQSPFTFNYWHNDANQRVNVSTADGSYWTYEYDSLGQVTSGKRYWSDGIPVAGQQFEYAFDDIGNRTSTKAGGDSVGGSLRSATYGANTLNQYTNRTVSGTFDVLGIAHAAATTTVNSATTYRKGEYFHKAVSVDNSTGAVYQAVTVQASATNGTDTTTGNVFLPKTAEVFTYDADGNLTSDGRWTNCWDAENRLVEMQPLSTIPSDAKKDLKFTYDSQGRRISKTVSNWTGSAWALSYDNRFVYDAWDLIADINATNIATVCSYMWGIDLSGSPQGAGGVGGLLAVSPAGNGAHFVAFDGNGNVAGLIGGSSGTNSAIYEYGIFGEMIRINGLAAADNRLRFSTKFSDMESDMICYGFRNYNLSIGAWTSRDPIEEAGGENLRALAKNDPINHFDMLGMYAPAPFHAKRIPDHGPCHEIVRKSGRPLMNFADNSARWQLTELTFHLIQGSGQSFSDEVTLAYEADVEVNCCCNGAFKVATGTRIDKAKHSISDEKEWIVFWDPHSGPAFSLTFKSILGGIGKIIGKVLKPNVPAASMLTPEDGATIVRIILEKRPSNAWDGNWKKGKSPCLE